MPKTAAVLQQEALARKRLHFPMYQQAHADAQPGGKSYRYTAQMKDKATADAKAQEAEKRLLRAAAEAGLDRHGNPL